VLWDVDYTLVDSGGTGRDLYEIAFREMFGRDMPQPGSMSGRTDRAIALEVLTLAGVPDPRGQVDAFHALMAARAPGLAGLARAQVRELPGAAGAVAALRDVSTAPLLPAAPTAPYKFLPSESRRSLPSCPCASNSNR
jgi:phosphoglycolate phosphatase